MKRAFSVMLRLAVVLAFGVYFTHRPSDPSVSATMSAIVPQRTPGAEAPVLGTSSDEDGVPSAVIGSDRLAEARDVEIAALREEVALLRAEVATVQQWMRMQRRTATGVASERADDPAKAPHTDLPARATAERERQQQVEVLETNFRHEATNPRWSFEAERAVQAALASDEVVQNTLLRLECRSQTCRVELADDDTGELAHAMPLLLQQLGQTLPSATAHYVDDSHDSKTMILYLGK